MKAVFAASCVAAALTGSAVRAQEPAASAPPPLPYRVLQSLTQDPVQFRQFLQAHPAPQAQPTEAASPPPGAIAWKNFPEAPGGTPLSNPLQLTDGSIIAHASCSRQWYRLTPDIDGDYLTGVWKPTGLLPGTYSPRFFGSAVLKDGRVLIEGGEYNTSSCADVETNRGAIFDPATDVWTAVAPPAGWSQIGDAESVVLPNQTYLLSTAANNDLATLDLTTLTWTSFLPTGKSDLNNEENWTLLPNGEILTVDAYVNGGCSDGSSLYKSSAKAWASAGATLHKLSGCFGSVANFEAPTQILLGSGKVAAFSSAASLPSQNTPTYTAIYDTAKSAWSAGPLMPKVGGVYYTMADAPASILPDGTALIAASPGAWQTNSSYPPPTHIFHFDGAAFTQLADLPNAAKLSSYEVNMLVLPTGDVLAVQTDYSSNSLYPASTAYPANPAYAPIVSAAPETVVPGDVYALGGNQLSGLTQGAVYGDDAQADTNFPLVRIVNNATHHVFYATTSNFTRSLAVNHPSKLDFKVAAGTEAGASKLYVVANGIASTATPITVK